MAILYLIMDEYVEGWQNLSTGEIILVITDKGLKQNFILTPEEPIKS